MIKVRVYLLVCTLSLVMGCAPKAHAGVLYYTGAPLAGVVSVEDMGNRLEIRQYSRLYHPRPPHFTIRLQRFEAVPSGRQRWILRNGAGKRCSVWTVHHSANWIRLTRVSSGDAPVSHRFFPESQKDLIDNIDSLMAVNAQDNQWLREGGKPSLPFVSTLERSGAPFHC